MKKLLLLTMLGFGYSADILAQSKFTKDAVTASSDSSNNNQGNKDVVTEFAKSINDQIYTFNDLFVTDGAGINANGGPRLNPRAVSFVEDYIEKNGKDLTKMKEWGRPFFNMMDGVLLQNSLPIQLKYLAVIESRLNPVSVSWAGAVGPWQFMPSTAIGLGLKVNHRVDERTNYIKSTKAAARYLTQLYSQFGDWLLVIAAYNGGPGNVLKAIRRSGSRNFWVIQNYLPTESRNHVKKFIGTHYIFEGQGGLTTLTRAEANDHYGVKGIYALNRNEALDAKGQAIKGKYHSLVVAKNVNMDVNEFNRYNPNFDKVMASVNNTYELRLPADKLELFNARKYQILNESIQFLFSTAASMEEFSKTEKISSSNKKKAGK